MGTKRNPSLENPPRPPRKRKREIYDPAKYKKLNEHIENTPNKLLNTDVKDLVKYLTKACTDDLAKVHALFYWVTSRSFFAIPHENSKKYSAIWYLNKIFTGHGNFAHFFYILCWHADIPCVIIGGVTKNSAYKMGFPFVTADMAAQWNAVYVEGDWHFTSIQWACIYANETDDWKRVVLVTEKELSYVENSSVDRDNHYNDPSIPQKPKTKDEYFHRVNDYYFLTDPDELIWTHFPNRKQWQLLDNPVSLEEFLSHFYVREQFYLLDMSLTEKSHINCVLLVDEYREIRIEFALPPKRNSTYRFKYTLSHHWSSWLSVKHQSVLQLAKYEVKDDRFFLTLHFPSEGAYKLDIFGSEQENCDFYLICSYVVKCSYTEEGPALPWKFFLGYGSGFDPLEKKVKTNDGRIKLPFPIERDATIMHVLSHKEKILEGCSLLRMIDDENESDFVTMIIELRLPEPGKYSLKVYEKKDAERKDLCDYCIIYNTNTETSPMLKSPTAKDSLVSQQNRIVVLSHPGSFIQTNLDTLKILFRSEYQLNCRLLTHDNSTRATMKTSVLHDMATKECQFNVSIPTCGDYTLKIFAKFSEEAVSGMGGGQFYELHSYRIRKLNSDHFSVRDLGTNRATSVYIVGTFETYQSVINISQTDFTNETLLVLQYQKEASVCSNLVNVFDVEDESNIQVALPKIGDYLLSLLKKDSTTGLIRNIIRYLLRRKQGIEKNNGAKNNNFQQESQARREKSGPGLNQKENEVNIREKTMENESQTLTKTSEPSKTEEKKTVQKVELEPSPRKIKPTQTDDIKAKETEGVDKETKLPNINNNKVGLISRVNNDVQKKSSEFSENKNVSLNQPKSSSKSIVNNQSAIAVDVEKSAEPIKSDQLTKIIISDHVKKKVGSENRDNTSKTSKPEEKSSKPNTKQQQEQPSEKQTDEQKRTEVSDNTLLHAITKRDTELLKSAISRSENHLKSDILNRAKKLLDVLQAKKDLVQAYDAREKGLLATALEKARRDNFDNELNEEIAVAHELYKRLCELDELRSAIGSFDYRAVAEVKSYSSPPKGVIVVMKSVFLILNIPENELKDWRQIRGLMRSIQNPFLRRILNCSPRCVSLESVKAAEVNLGMLRAEDISCVSEMATVLFTWVKKMIEEAKNQELNIDLGNLKK